MEKVGHPAHSRGTANFGWLNTNYSFSFANFFNPDRIQFGQLRRLKNGQHPGNDQKDFSDKMKKNGQGNVKSPETDQSTQPLGINSRGCLHPGIVQAGRNIDYELKNENHGVIAFFEKLRSPGCRNSI